MGRLGKAMERLDRMMQEGAVLDWVDRNDALVVTSADGNSHTWSAKDVLLVWIGYIMGKKVARDELEARAFVPLIKAVDAILRDHYAGQRRLDPVHKTDLIDALADLPPYLREIVEQVALERV